MKLQISSFPFKNYFSILTLVFTIHNISAQTVRQQKMEQLSFMIGDWVGISTAFENGKMKKQVPAYEKISYKLDQNIITIDLQSESLQLHTIIYYDEKAEKYYYHPYYKTGTARYEAMFKDNKFIVTPNDTKRFIFHLTKEGKFQEYGEKFENGKWIKYFEDNFTKML